MTSPLLGNIGIGASGGGSILSAIGAARKGDSTSKMYSYQAGLADARRRVALQNRDYAVQQGGQEGVRFGMKAGVRRGELIAAQGASGLDVGGETATRVRKSQELVSRIDQATIADNAARKAYGYEAEAAYQEAQTGLYKFAAKDAKIGAAFDVMSSLTSGATSVSSKWLQGNQTGLWEDSVLGPTKVRDSDHGYW